MLAGPLLSILAFSYLTWRMLSRFGIQNIVLKTVLFIVLATALNFALFNLPGWASILGVNAALSLGVAIFGYPVLFFVGLFLTSEKKT